MSTELLSPRDVALVDAVARRVLELLDERQAQPRSQLADAATVARLLGLSRSTVYEHAAELGAVQVGNGAKPRLRFDVDRAREAWTRRDASERSQPAETADEQPVSARSARRRRSAARTDRGLLPIRGSVPS